MLMLMLVLVVMMVVVVVHFDHVYLQPLFGRNPSQFLSES
jgi:hypothetical protein